MKGVGVGRIKVVLKMIFKIDFNSRIGLREREINDERQFQGRTILLKKK